MFMPALDMTLACAIPFSGHKPRHDRGAQALWVPGGRACCLESCLEEELLKRESKELEMIRQEELELERIQTALALRKSRLEAIVKCKSDMRASAALTSGMIDAFK